MDVSYHPLQLGDDSIINTQGKYTKDKKAWVQNSRDGRGSFFFTGQARAGWVKAKNIWGGAGQGIVVGD